MHNILSKYESESGQPINCQKSGIFLSKNVAQGTRHSISDIIGESTPLNTGKYLGLPSLMGKSKKSVFNFLRDRLGRRIQGWQSKLLSQAGKEILIKVAGQAIPAYCMSTFLLPLSLIAELQKMMNSFWWGSKLDRTKIINWLS